MKNPLLRPRSWSAFRGTSAESRPRRAIPRWLLLVSIGFAVGASLVVGSILLLATGQSPVWVYSTMAASAFGSMHGVSETLLTATPLMLTGLAAAVAFRMQLWNIGGEGQLYIGAIFGSGVALLLGDSFPRFLSPVIVLLAAALGGAVWAFLAAWPRAFLGANEIITTLMLNYIALNFMDLLIFGPRTPWRDFSSRDFPKGRAVPDAAELPTVLGRLHIGIFVAVTLAIAIWWLLRRTKFGFEIRVINESPMAAKYAGIVVSKRILAVLCVSGALAGLAGGMEVIGPIGALEPRALAANLGFSGIVVAALARLNPLAVIATSIVVATIHNGRFDLQAGGVPFAIVLVLEGVLLLLVVASDFLVRRQMDISLARRRADQAVEDSDGSPVGEWEVAGT